jgi:holo-[acyl-carrier protein] synthase
VIIGIGVDVVDIDRFAETLERTPSLRERLFTPAERTRGIASLAARFAAKEAIAKALGAPTGMGWHDAEIVSNDAGDPSFLIRGTVQARADTLGVGTIHVSMSHDAGIASAFVVLES